MRYAWMILVGVLLVPQPVAAQAVTHLQVTMYRTGSTTPAVAPFEIPVASMACDQTQTPPPTGIVANPNVIAVEDPARPTRECRWQETGTGIIAMLGYDPVNTYFARTAWRNSVGYSVARTDSNTFSLPGTVPSVPPAFVRLVRGQ